MSESIKAGYMPWWNPYVNFGIPQYADMSSGFWSPVTWLIAGTAGYNVYTITIELLFYILVGGWGMYKIGDLWNWHKHLRYIAAISYMTSGFMTGHLQHLNWISAAGFLPWCIWSLWRLTRKRDNKVVAASVILFYLYLSSSHPGMIIGGVYYFMAFTIVLLFKKETFVNNSYLQQKERLWQLIIFGFLLAILSSGMIYSYLEILPYITRSEKPVQNLVNDSTTVKNWISFLIPSITLDSSEFSNDIALRNCYIGLVGLSGLILSLRYFRQNIFWFLSGIIFLLLASDIKFTKHVRDVLPLMPYVRLHGEFRIFAILSFLIAGINGLCLIPITENVFSLKKYKSIIILVISSLLFACFIMLISDDRLLGHLKYVLLNDSDIRDNLKYFLKKIPITLVVLAQLITSLTLTLFLISKKYLNQAILLTICITDILVNNIIQLPYTGVGKKPPYEIQKMLEKSPRGIPIPSNIPLKYYDYGDAETTATIGDWSFYNKQPGNTKQAPYPIKFLIEENIFDQNSMQTTKSNSLVHLQTFKNDSNDSTRQNCSIIDFTPNKIQILIDNDIEYILTIHYKLYKHWTFTAYTKYTTSDSGYPFFKFHLKPGKKSIIFIFNPKPIKLLFYANFVTLLILIYMISPQIIKIQNCSIRKVFPRV